MKRSRKRLKINAMGTATRIVAAWSDCQKKTSPRTRAVGTPVLIFGIQMMLGHKRPWLPGFILRRTVSVAKFKRLIDIAEPKLQKLESYCRPRLTQLFSVFGDRMVGLFAVLVALSVLIPFPGTNFPPSIALVIASIAVMEEDGYLLILGYLIENARKRRAVWSSTEELIERLRDSSPLAGWRDEFLRAYVTYGTQPRDDGLVELKCPPEIEAQVYAAARAHDGWERLADLACPTLLLTGDDSPMWGGGRNELAEGAHSLPSRCRNRR